MIGNRINFYGKDKSFGYFSNFYPSPFNLDGHKWPTVEHYFQAFKFEGDDHFHTIRTCKTARKAKQLGRTRKLATLRKDWNEVRIEIMKRAIREKFTQNADLQQKLLETGDSYLSEHTPRDSFWGDGGNDKGENWTGKCIMAIREELKKKNEKPEEEKKRNETKKIPFFL